MAKLPPTIAVLEAEIEKTSIANTEKSKIGDTLAALRARYFELIDLHIDTSEALFELDEGTAKLAEEAYWRQRGRPIEYFRTMLEEASGSTPASASFDENSLRSLSYGVAVLRDLDDLLSERSTSAKAALS